MAPGGLECVHAVEDAGRTLLGARPWRLADLDMSTPYTDAGRTRLGGTTVAPGGLGSIPCESDRVMTARVVSIGASYEPLRPGETRRLPGQSDYMSQTGGYITPGWSDAARPGRGS